jgi:hypothetical protein
MRRRLRTPVSALSIAGLSLSAALIACGASSTRPSERREPIDGGNVTVTEDSTATAATTATATAATTTATTATASTAGPVTNACPSSFGDAQRRNGCVIGSTPACSYAEGACTCNQFPNCGGVMRAPAPPGGPGMWNCGSNDPRVLDPAGCAYVVPKDGASCSTAGKRCAYGACSWSQTVATCQGGAWHVEVHRGPPPP